MKRIFLFTNSLCISALLMAGGIVTNTNQSASWVRNPSTASMTGIEAAYYNPAGIMKLDNGFHLSLNNQFITQNREIENFYKGPGDTYGLNQSLYKGSVKAPLFPSFYAVYKMDKLAFSVGFNPIGGGGSAEFKNGLPSFEFAASDLVPKFKASGAQHYKLESYFKGTSVYYGIQLGVAYKINDMISVSAGVRYIKAKNTYEGYLRNIQLEMGTTWMPASAVLAGASSKSYQASSDLNPLVIAAPTITIDQAVGEGYLTSGKGDTIIANLVGMGFTPSQVDTMSVGYVQGAFYTAGVTAGVGSKLVRNQSADVEQTGSGICPIIGVDLSLGKLNVGIKYEFAVNMDLTNNTTKDFVTDSLPGQQATTMFPDKAKTPADMPAMLSIGASYKVIDKLSLSGSYYYYFDKGVGYGKKLNGEYVQNDKLMDHNFYEFALGAEYNVSDKILVSAGFLHGVTGVKPAYNSDLSFSNSSSTIGVGGKYSINSNIAVNLGFAYTKYLQEEKTDTFSKSFSAITAKETYLKNNVVIGAGLDIRFGK
jgi:long-chain fatty acid transport protein